MNQTISDEALAALVCADSAREALAALGPDGKGWMLQIRYGVDDTLHTLRSQRRPVRMFRTLDSLSRYCAGIGLVKLNVQLIGIAIVIARR